MGIAQNKSNQFAGKRREVYPEGRDRCVGKHGHRAKSKDIRVVFYQRFGNRDFTRFGCESVRSISRKARLIQRP